MGLYSNGISGIDPMKLKIYESNAINLKNEYKKIADKLKSLKEQKIKTDIIKWLDYGKENWKKAYKSESESGKVKQIIDEDFKDVTELIKTLYDSLETYADEAINRSVFYETLESNCANAYTNALNECNSSGKDFASCARFSIIGKEVTYTIL